jgi:hypothetical protein
VHEAALMRNHPDKAKKQRDSGDHFDVDEATLWPTIAFGMLADYSPAH